MKRTSNPIRADAASATSNGESIERKTLNGKTINPEIQINLTSDFCRLTSGEQQGNRK